MNLDSNFFLKNYRTVGKCEMNRIFDDIKGLSILIFFGSIILILCLGFKRDALSVIDAY